jgi:hypothetical protein
MKTLQAAGLLVLAGTLCACASGGGGNGCSFFYSGSDPNACGAAIGASLATQPTVPPTLFTTWSAVGPNSTVVVSGRSNVTTYSENLAQHKIGGVGSVFTPFDSGATYTQTLNGASQLTNVTIVAAPWGPPPGIVTNIPFAASNGDQIGTLPGSPTTLVAKNAAGSNLAVGAYPAMLGWNYQSFGVWITGLGTQDSADNTIGATTVGAATAAANVPSSGTVAYIGKAGGIYVAPDGTHGVTASNMNAVTNFATRSITFSTAATILSTDSVTSNPAPGLNLIGTLNYNAGSSAFSGDITSTNGMAGPAQGLFYGPNAEEVGGVFVTLGTTVETFTGAFGGKR